jgi:hypothetical protein
MIKSFSANKLHPGFFIQLSTKTSPDIAETKYIKKEGENEKPRELF